MERRETRHELIAERAIVERKIEFIKEKCKTLKQKSNLGRRFSERTFETFDKQKNTKAYVTATRYAKEFKTNEGKGLLIAGPVGTGKTHLTAAIATYVMENFFVPVKFITAVDLFNGLHNFDDSRFAEDLKSVDLLVIDDLGKEKITDWRLEKLFEIINARYEDYKPIVITTNYTNSELENRIGAAIYSRICEMCRLVIMDGEDRRKGATI